MLPLTLAGYTILAMSPAGEGHEGAASERGVPALLESRLG
jgi:hypothetical protein